MPQNEYVGKLADPEFRRERAKKASEAAHGIDRAVERVVAGWPDLTPEQKDRLAGLVRTGGAR